MFLISCCSLVCSQDLSVTDSASKRGTESNPSEEQAPVDVTKDANDAKDVSDTKDSKDVSDDDTVDVIIDDDNIDAVSVIAVTKEFNDSSDSSQPWFCYRVILASVMAVLICILCFVVSCRVVSRLWVRNPTILGGRRYHLQRISWGE